ncbi:MAG: iron-containing alcohol dehydrogenase [Clostridia bacterium]|jgi:alcohol dehydrogenase|nr:iron-containing alcohol dehydrogenase [Clostridia bacterium]
MLQFENYVPVRIVFGAKKLESVGEHAKALGSKALIVTTGPFFKESGLIDRVAGYLKEAGVQSEVFMDASPNPHSDEADAGAAFAKETGCDVVIGLGGGSAIDAAKCIAVGAAQGEPTWPYWIGEKDIFAALPIIAVTTTSGTGSHITPYSVITNTETNEKPGAGADVMYPKVAIVDSELMATLPAKMTAATGFDVLAHAIEAYTSNDANPFSDQYAEEAIKLVGKYLKRAIDDGSDAEARDGMAMADTYSGCAISIAVITMCHAMAHAVGGVCNTVHGESLAAMTPSTMRHSISGRPEKYKKIGELLSSKDVASAEASVDVVAAFIKDIGMAIPLNEQGVKESDFDEIIAGATGYMAGGMELDPVLVTPEDVRKVLEDSL